MTEFFFGIAGLCLGGGAVALLFRLRLGTLRSLANEILSRAEGDARTRKTQLLLTLKEEELAHRRSLDEMSRRLERRLTKDEESLKQREEELDKRTAKLKVQEKQLAGQQALETRLEQTQARLDKQLEEAAGMTRAEARAHLLARLEREASAARGRRIAQAEAEADTSARKIIATAIGRLAVPTTTSATMTTVSLPNDALKGRIVGREGRNVRTLERLTGATFVLDDTPGAVVISAFDPLRKEIARRALTELVLDGRIHPTRIEEAVEMATSQVSVELRERGQEAAVQAGISLHPELERLLGQLHLRYSLGQNVLSHSLEVSHLLGLMCAELGLDEQLGRRIGLLHDVGKALTPEMEGTHALIGRDIALKYGESEAVANGIGCHHDEIAPTTLEGSLCSAADAISAARPGARAEPLDRSIKRMHKLEAIASKRPGVLEAHALQAGRELRVLVQPDAIDDEGLFDLASGIAQEVASQLNFPGKIRVAVERHSKVVQYTSGGRA